MSLGFQQMEDVWVVLCRTCVSSDFSQVSIVSMYEAEIDLTSFTL